MQVSASLNQKIVQAVQTSMRIEGCKPVQSAAVKKQAQALMEQHRVQVSKPTTPGKPRVYDSAH